MSEAVLHEIGAHGFGHGVFADDAFESEQHAGGFAISDTAIGSETVELVGFLRHGIAIGGGDGVAEPLLAALAQVMPARFTMEVFFPRIESITLTSV